MGQILEKVCLEKVAARENLKPREVSKKNPSVRVMLITHITI